MLYLAAFVSEHSLICNNLSDLLGSQKHFPLHSLKSCSSLKVGGIHHCPVKYSDATITYSPNLVLFCFLRVDCLIYNHTGRGSLEVPCISSP